jgi:nicotinamidase-related amidase
VGLYSGVRDIGLRDLKHNVVSLAKAAQALDLPTVVTTTMADGLWGPLIPELREALPSGQEVIDRSTVNAWHDERVGNAVTEIGRSKLIIAGVSLEVCAALPAIAATAEGFDAYVAVDASGTFWETSRGHCQRLRDVDGGDPGR